MSTSPERPPVELEQQQAEVPTSTTSNPASRSLLSFLGAQPRSNPLSLNPDPAKRRKKNPEPTQHTQGRIVLGTSGGAAWGVEKRPEEVVDVQNVGVNGNGNGKASNGRGKGKGKGKGGGEEDELKEMGKRAKAAQRGRGGKRGGAGKRKAVDKDGELNLRAMNGEDDELDGADDPLLPKDHSAEQNQSLPAKQKRGRPPKTKPPSEAGPSRRSTRSVSTTKDTHIPYVRSSSPNDIEVTGGSQNGTAKNGARRPRQPVFSRANTSSTTDLRGQTHKDAIDVENTVSPVKPGPKKLVFASDTKPAHSFFSKPPQTASVATPPEATMTSLNNGCEPIPEPKAAEVTASGAPSKQVHNFFQPIRSDAKTTTMKKGWGHGIKEGEEWLPPWPGAEWPVHLGQVDTLPQAGPSRPRRSAPEVRPCEDDGFWQSFLTQAERSSIQATRHPQRTNHLPQANGDRETYCDRFRPKTASQVLGNTTEATYLRDWLSTLVVGTKDGSGPRVIRKVPKRKLRLDDWIVDDIGEFGDEEPEEEVELLEPYDEPDLPMGERPNTYAPLSSWLTNTILLSGPNGSGKSAAVYAAATELGWEVFEVYPGIGKRTGGNLMSLVGDVGKNHMVGKVKDVEITKPSPAGLTAFFGSTLKDVESEEAPPPGSQGEPIEIDDDHPERQATPPPRLRNPSMPTTPFRDEAKFRQSLILLEEVDILFDEEATFWPAVIALIAESKRPVVMTCNDPERVMLDALPLQAILQFKPPPRDSAIAHLALLSDQLGLERETDYLESLYERSMVNPSQILPSPGPPNGNEWLPTFDLRRAIMQLQLERGVPVETPPASINHLEDLGKAIKRAELVSYTDAHLAERSWATMELSEIDRYEPTLDDQLGVKTLLKPELPDLIPTLPAYDRTSEISSFLLKNIGSASPPDDLFTIQILYIRSLLPLLDPIIPLSSRLLPHPTLFTEYMPTIQHLVQIDDIRQAHWDACTAAGEDVRDIKTGRPVRVTSWVSREYTRVLPLEEGALQVARKTLRYE